MERAAWIPGWYALDQPVKVGLTSDFWFFKDPRTEVLHRGPERLVFYNALWGSHAALGGSGTITRITSPELGDILEVDTKSEPFDYAFHLADGTTIEVNAEEQPGWVWDGTEWSPPRVDNWHLTVELDSLSELRLSPPRPRLPPLDSAQEAELRKRFLPRSRWWHLHRRR